MWNKTIFPGDIVYVKGLNSYFIVDDTMNKRWTNRFDIFKFSKAEALKLYITSDVYVISLAK